MKNKLKIKDIHILLDLFFKTIDDSENPRFLGFDKF